MGGWVGGKGTYLATGLVSLGGNGIELVDKENSGSVLLGVFKSLAELGFGLARHLLLGEVGWTVEKIEGDEAVRMRC